jgi:hypothetical protein
MVESVRCVVAPITNIRPHPELSHLKVAEVAGHQVITGDHYVEGQLGVFIPAGTIVPDELADEMWVLGKLGGNKRNKVKSTVRAGVRSEGLFYADYGVRWNNDWIVGQDVTEELLGV